MKDALNATIGVPIVVTALWLVQRLGHLVYAWLQFKPESTPDPVFLQTVGYFLLGVAGVVAGVLVAAVGASIGGAILGRRAS